MSGQQVESHAEVTKWEQVGEITTLDVTSALFGLHDSNWFLGSDGGVPGDSTDMLAYYYAVFVGAIEIFNVPIDGLIDAGFGVYGDAGKNWQGSVTVIGYKRITKVDHIDPKIIHVKNAASIGYIDQKFVFLVCAAGVPFILATGDQTATGDSVKSVYLPDKTAGAWIKSV